MSERILELAKQAGLRKDHASDREYIGDFDWRRFAELIQQAIYDDVKQELIEDEVINIEPDRDVREYLKGCNGGIVDALYHIKNFGVEIEL